jgi:hypothetical protein
MDLTIKRIPESLCEAMQREAQSPGRNLNDEEILTLEAEAAELERRRRLKTLRKELDRFVESLVPSNNAVALIRENRNR